MEATTTNYVRNAIVWVIIIIIEKFATTNNPWHPMSGISWTTYSRALKGSGISLRDC
jgi:hypothetical protein